MSDDWAPAIEQAVATLARQELVVMPTETVYGLAADASCPAAVAKIFALKGRPSHHPLIVHLHSAQQMQDWAREIPQVAWELARRFWPGPLTLILRRSPRVPIEVTGGHPSVGLRVPGHPMARALLSAFSREHSGAVAAPSANRFGRVSPTCAAHVRAEFGPDTPLILDGGPCTMGIESTIVDLTQARPSILRAGALDGQRLHELLELGTQAGTVRAPGTLPSHYAVSMPTFQRSKPPTPRQGLRLGWLGVAPPEPIPGLLVHNLAASAQEFARGLYAGMRHLEDQGVDALFVQTPPDEVTWDGVRDRLRKACHPSESLDPRSFVRDADAAGSS